MRVWSWMTILLIYLFYRYISIIPCTYAIYLWFREQESLHIPESCFLNCTLYEVVSKSQKIFPKYFEQCIGLNFQNVWTLTSDLFYDLAISVQPMAHLRNDINHCQNAFHHERRKTTESSVRSTWQNSVRLDIALRLCNGQQCVTQSRNF